MSVYTEPYYEVPPSRLPDDFREHVFAARIEKDDQVFYEHFFSSKIGVRMCQADAKVVSVELRERQEGDPETPYWGWEEFDNTSGRPFSMIFRHFHLLEMCFPYGSKVEVERDRGRPVNLVVEEV